MSWVLGCGLDGAFDCESLVVGGGLCGGGPQWVVPAVGCEWCVLAATLPGGAPGGG